MRYTGRGVYAIKNLATGAMYVGESVDCDTRIYQHFSALHRRDYRLYPSRKKWQEDYDFCGEDGFEAKIMLICPTRKELVFWEDIIIKDFSTRYSLYNHLPQYIKEDLQND